MRMSETWLSVTVSRINEGLHETPYITLQARSVTVHPDGTLAIKEAHGERHFVASGWDRFEVKRTRMPRP